MRLITGKYGISKFLRGSIFVGYHFMGLVFADACAHAHYVLHNRAYFMGFFSTIRPSSVKKKTVKIRPLKISRYTVRTPQRL